MPNEVKVKLIIKKWVDFGSSCNYLLSNETHLPKRGVDMNIEYLFTYMRICEVFELLPSFKDLRKYYKEFRDQEVNSKYGSEKNVQQ